MLVVLVVVVVVTEVVVALVLEVNVVLEALETVEVSVEPAVVVDDADPGGLIGERANQIPPNPWPLRVPADLSPAKR